MAKALKDDLSEAKRIAARLLQMPPDPHKKQDKPKPSKPKSPDKRTSGKGRARVGKSGN